MINQDFHMAGLIAKHLAGELGQEEQAELTAQEELSVDSPTAPHPA